MSSAVCDWCSNYIEASNHRFPGFCSTDCRNLDRASRDHDAAQRARSRRDAAQHRRATNTRHRINYLS